MLFTVLIFSFLLVPLPSEEESAPLNPCVQDSIDKECMEYEGDQKEGESAYDIVKNIFDFSLFKRAPYLLYCLGLISFFFGHYIPDMYLPEYAISNGISEQRAANLISILGCANMTSRLIIGLIADIGPRLRLCVCGVSLASLGIISVVLPFCETYPTFFAYAILFGIFVGGIGSLFSVILVDLYGLEIIEKSLGQALTFTSPVFLFGPPFIGFLIDILGIIEVAFYIPGIVATVGGFVFLSIFCFHDFNKQKYERIT